MSQVFLRRLSRWQAEDQRDDFADLQSVAYRGTPQEATYDRDEFLRRFADHVQQPEFEMIIASNPALVGCSYGFRVDRDSTWWDGFQDIPEHIEQLTASQHVFCLAELMVLPEERRHHVGGKLHDQVLSRSGAPVAITLLEPGDVPARTAFQAWGWTKTGQLHRRSDATPLEAWIRQAP
ncbi:hypothetical protein PJ985_08280 [Streptomyces sp. ACA25]|uniref:hypothetical protein n=1 Tax=Streptomyces sp. ACA25 TaxID=3022596 RepID=UPI0023074C6C|nr:hypothetical protein [Streptomyces sp. ACA25]MDB1087562.1 hypothetical protein [Streptomyces sp. ACA25]